MTTLFPRRNSSSRGRRAAAGVALALLVAIGGLLSQARAGERPPPLLLDTMDGTAPTFKLIDAGVETRILRHAVAAGLGADGGAAERVLVAIPAGRSAHLAYDLPPIPAVIPEVRLAATIKCNRPGAQLAAMVVLPHSPDPKTGAPRRMLIRSGETAPEGSWQEISLDDLPAHLADHARVARAKDGGAVDEREAFIAQLVILAPGGAGATELAVDEITVHGVLAPGRSPAQVAAAGPSRDVALAAATAPLTPAPRRPLVPRIIQWQGEPLELLRRLGFDAVGMGRLPTPEELTAAARLGLHIVCPPPLPQQLAGRQLGSEFDGVLAWDLGALVDAADVPAAHRWAQAIEQAETRPDRPVLLQPYGMPREASRIADLVMLGRPRLGSTQTWTEYAAALSQQRRLARPGAPVWINVETHCGPRFMAQLAALRDGRGPDITPATFSELSHATTAAFGVAPRGFYFQSHTSLARGDVENQLRSLALELTNMRLGLAEPWLAAGKTAVAARSSRPELTGLVLKVERSHLIIPLVWAEPAAPAASDGGQPTSVSFDLPGVPESCDAYLVSISGSQRLPGRRVTGGLRITIDRLPDDAFVLVTEDGYAFSHVERYLREHAPRAAQVRVELAALRRQQAAQALAKAPPQAAAACGAREALARVDAQLTAVAETIRRRDLAAAFTCAAEAERLLDAAQTRLAAAIAPSLTPGTSPVPIDWSTMTELALVERLATPTPTAMQAIPGGEFDSLDALLQNGWQRVQNATPGVETAVRLSPAAPARGEYCLELEARTAAGQPPPILPAAPVWVTSPPIAVPPGSLVEISGLVRVGERPIGSSDPLLIFDAAGGEEAAIRVRTAPSWTPFRMVRAAAPGGELRVTIALAGVGLAQVDSLQFRFIPLRADALAQAPPTPP